MGLTRAAIARPVFVLMLMLAAFLMGWISYRSMRVELNPEVASGVVSVTTSYPGANADTINTQISRRIEEAVSSVSNVQEVMSTSVEGSSSVTVSLVIGANSDVALNDVRSKVDGIVNQLPKNSLKPRVSKFDFSSQPVLVLAFSSSKMTSAQLRDLMDDKITDRFAQINGVASAGVQGGDVREIQVRMKPEKLVSYGIGINDVTNAIQAANIDAPGGRLTTKTQEYTVRIFNQFETVDQLRNLIFNISDPNNPNNHRSVHLTDVADIVDTVRDRTAYSRLNGSDTIVLQVQKAIDGNAVDIAKAGDGVIAAIEKEFAAQGLHVEKTLDTAEMIQDSLSDVQFALFFGIFLVATIVFVFLHNFRGTMIVALAIPTSIFASFIALKLAGFTINNMSMLALSLAIGVLVDDAIVVLENIYRHLKMGEDPREAAINGRSEIGLAAIAITMADVVVFLPIAFMGGIVGQFFKPMALTFVFATLFSLFVSFTLTPMLASRWYRRGEDMEHPSGRFAQWFERRFTALENVYRRALEWALNHRWFVFISGFVVLLSVFAFIIGSFIPPQAGPKYVLFALTQFIGTSIFLGVVVYALNFLRGLNWPLVRPPWVWKGRRQAPPTLSLAWSVPIWCIFCINAFSSLPPKATEWLAANQYTYFPAGLQFAFLSIFVVALVVNGMRFAGGRPIHGKLRYLASAVAFAAIFPLSGLAGQAYAGWKKESVFKFSFIPDSDAGQVSASIELPAGSSLDETQKYVSMIERVMMAEPDVKYVVANLGGAGGGGFASGNSGPNYAQVNATLYDTAAVMDRIKGIPKGKHIRTRSSDAVAAGMLVKVGKVPGAKINISAGSSFGFGSAIQLSLTSDDRTALMATAEKIRAGLATSAIPGVINPDITSKPGKPEIRATPDSSAMADANVTVAEAASALTTLYSGNTDSKIRALGREWSINVIMDPEARNNPAAVSQIPIKFSQGRPVKLGDVAKITTTPAISRITRRNRAEEVQVTADLLPGYANGSVMAQLTKWIDDQHLMPPNVHLRPLGQADAQNREMGFLLGAMGIGIVLVYMLLASLYDNLLYPLIIQLATPQAIVGALMALMIFNKALNIVGMIGVIALMGLVGKNAILVVDYANTLRDRGRNRHDALVEAGPTRLRPIMMTTLALILGMLPVALAIGRGSEFRETIGITIIGGITLSTMLTLLVIPCSYTIFDDASIGLGKLFYGRRRSAAAKTLEPIDEAPPVLVDPDRPDVPPVIDAPRD